MLVIYKQNNSFMAITLELEAKYKYSLVIRYDGVTGAGMS